MSDPEPPLPRVTVKPSGRPLTGQIHRWRQAPDGTWWAELTVRVPAAAVEQVYGQDYRQVPREFAEVEPRYVFDNALRGTDGKPRMRLHVVTGKPECTTLHNAPAGTLTTPVTPDDARGMLRTFGDTVACDTCNPQP